MSENLSGRGGGYLHSLREGLARAVTSLARRVRPAQPQHSDIKQHEPLVITEESISVRFPPGDYRYFRDTFQQLQQGSHYDPETDNFTDLVLDGESAESSRNMGWAGNQILRTTIVGLREGRVNEEGRSYVLCTDEVSDTQVLQNATSQDKVQFIAEAISDTVNDFGFPVADYVTAAVAAAAILTGREIEQARQLVEQVALGAAKDPHRQTALSHELQNLSVSRVRRLLSFIKSSKQRLINEETKQTFKHGPREYGTFQEAYEASIETGEPLFNIKGQDFAAVKDQASGAEPYKLNEREVEMIKSLREAVHQSRNAMVAQARLLAVRSLGLVPNASRVPNPPEWWLRKKTEGLRSDEILVYIPSGVSERTKIDYPTLLKGFNGGWYLLKIFYDADDNLRLKSVVGQLHD